MGSSRIKKYDRNRWRKVYPRIRVMPSNSFKATKHMVIETMEIEFNGDDRITFDLKERYETAPTIVVTPMGDNSDLNVYVESVAITGGVPPGRGIAQITLAASAECVGSVWLQSTLIV